MPTPPGSPFQGLPTPTHEGDKEGDKNQSSNRSPTRSGGYGVGAGQGDIEPRALLLTANANVLAEFRAFLAAPQPVAETTDPELSERIKRNATLRAFGSPVYLNPDCRVYGEATANLHPTGVRVKLTASPEPRENQKELVPESRGLDYLRYRWSYLSLTLLVECIITLQNFINLQRLDERNARRLLEFVMAPLMDDQERGSNFRMAPTLGQMCQEIENLFSQRDVVNTFLRFAQKPRHEDREPLEVYLVRVLSWWFLAWRAVHPASVMRGVIQSLPVSHWKTAHSGLAEVLSDPEKVWNITDFLELVQSNQTAFKELGRIGWNRDNGRQEIDVVRTPKKEAAKTSYDKNPYRKPRKDGPAVKKVLPKPKRERQEGKVKRNDRKESKKFKRLPQLQPKCLACHLPGHQWANCPEEELKARVRDNLVEKKRAKAYKEMNKNEDSLYLKELSFQCNGTESSSRSLKEEKMTSEKPKSDKEYRSLDTSVSGPHQCLFRVLKKTQTTCDLTKSE